MRMIIICLFLLNCITFSHNDVNQKFSKMSDKEFNLYLEDIRQRCESKKTKCKEQDDF